MGHRNLIGSIGAVLLSTLKGVVLFVAPLKFVALGLAFLIIADLRFFIKKKRVKNEYVALHSAITITFSKALDYLCLILVASSIQQIFVQSQLEFPLFPLVAFVILGMCELQSVVNNFREMKGLSKINIYKLIVTIFKKKAPIIGEIADAFEDENQPKTIEK